MTCFHVSRATARGQVSLVNNSSDCLVSLVKGVVGACPSNKLRLRLTGTRGGYAASPCVVKLVEEGYLLKSRREIGLQSRRRAGALPWPSKPRAGRDRCDGTRTRPPMLLYPCACGEGQE